MPPIEIGPSGLHGPRASGATDARIVKTGHAAPQPTTGNAGSGAAAATVVRSAALDAGPAPVDTDRVQVIRKAIESGSYPVIPTRVADAMIAAGMLLRSDK